MTITWTESNTIKLIVLYGQHECLRNPFHPDFNNKLCRYKAYREITNSMSIHGLTICDCVKRITYMKRRYCYELSKIGAAISCEKFYKPTTSWFELMHDLLFPYIQTCDCSNNSLEDEEESVRSQTCDLARLACENSEKVPKDASSKWRETLERKPYFSNSRLATPSLVYKSDRDDEISVQKSVSYNADSSDSPTYPTTSKLFKTQYVNTEIETNDTNTAESETQTDTVYVKTDSKHNDVLAPNTYIQEPRSNVSDKEMKDNSQNTGEADGKTDSKGKKKRYDEFDIFGKNIAIQLRNIDLESAIELEKQIQDLILKERLNIIKLKCQGCNLDYSCTCSECKLTSKEEMCICGLPVSACLPAISMKMDYCEFCRKKET